MFNLYAILSKSAHSKQKFLKTIRIFHKLFLGLLLLLLCSASNMHVVTLGTLNGDMKMKKACESYACCWYSAKGKISNALLHLLFIITVILGLNISSVHAEGSRTLYPNGYAGSRADLDLEASEGRYVGKVRRSGFLYVYAQAGEYIVLGSRNRSSGGDINVYNPQDFGVPGDEIYNALTPGTPDFTCSGGSTQPGTHYSGGTRGTIANRAQELAGPKSADNSATVLADFARAPTRRLLPASMACYLKQRPARAALPTASSPPLL